MDHYTPLAFSQYELLTNQLTPGLVVALSRFALLLLFKPHLLLVIASFLLTSPASHVRYFGLRRQ